MGLSEAGVKYSIDRGCELKIGVFFDRFQVNRSGTNYWHRIKRSILSGDNHIILGGIDHGNSI